MQIPRVIPNKAVSVTENIFEDGGEFYRRGDEARTPVEWHPWKNGDVSYWCSILNGSFRVDCSGRYYLGNSDRDLLPLPPKPPRFSHDDQYVYDTEQPGMRSPVSLPLCACRKLTAGEFSPDIFYWEPIPEKPPRFTHDGQYVYDTERPGMRAEPTQPSDTCDRFNKKFTNPNHFIWLPIPPKLVPWESPVDVPCPCWIRYDSHVSLVADVCNKGVETFHDYFSFASLLSCTWASASNAPDADWKPCGKQA